MFGNTAVNVIAAFKAVSYTHLDVYKRQLSRSAGVIQAPSPDNALCKSSLVANTVIWFDNSANTPESVLSSMPLNCIISVSYTHLDVYKRQHLMYSFSIIAITYFIYLSYCYYVYYLFNFNHGD